MLTVKELLRGKGGAFVASVGPDARVVTAAREMSLRRIGSLIVLANERVVGIVTERDLLTRVVAERRDPETTTVGEIMTRDVIRCRVDTSIDECRRVISARRVRHLPVVDPQDRLVGIVTSGDILEHELAQQGEAIETLQAYIYGAAHPPPRSGN